MKAYPWRNLGNISYDLFVAHLDDFNSPLLPWSGTIWEWARPHSYLLDRQLQHESAYATTGRLCVPYPQPGAGRNVNAHNPLGLRPRRGVEYLPQELTQLEGVAGNFLVFAAWPNCIYEWYDRIIDPTYAYAVPQTVEEYIHIFAPTFDNNNEAAYVDKIYAPLSAWKPLTPETFFPEKRMFTTVSGATGRSAPNREAPRLRLFNASTPIRARGWRRGELVSGSDKWLVLEGRSGIHVHSSGVKETWE